MAAKSLRLIPGRRLHSAIGWAPGYICRQTINRALKAKLAWGIILGVLLLDQWVKVYVKTHFHLRESVQLAGERAQLFFVENEGMAWGWQLGGDHGKLILTLFRLVAVLAGTFYIAHIVRKRYHSGFIAVASLIYAGAAGNLIDSMFYGMVFSASGYSPADVAHTTAFGHGYGSFLHGRVVDMLYFPLFTIHNVPDWVPMNDAGSFTFFPAIFNVADAAITCGVIALLIWQNKILPDQKKKEEVPAKEV